MRTVSLSPRVRQLSWLGLFNCYLVEDASQEITLVDTGAFGRWAEEIRGVAGDRLRRVVLTHSHADHVSGLETLMSSHASSAVPLEVAMSEREARIMGGDHRLEGDEPNARLRGLLPTLAVRPTRLLADGDTVGSMRVVASPGHTPGHIALLNDDGVLLAGDAFLTIFGLRVCGEDNPLFPFTQAATWHAPTAVASARRLTELLPTVLAVGHGPALTDPGPAMHEALQRCEQGERRR